MKRNWTKEETIIAYNVYCKVPFNKSSKTNPLIIEYAKILDRSPSALNMKIGNFGRLDPDLKLQGISGLTHGSKMEEEVWNEFYNNWDELAYESELLIQKFKNNRQATDETHLPEGKDQLRIVKTRINQSFFRSSILSSYNSTCAVTGIKIEGLLVASHIKPWSEDNKNRTNPHNGICLNSLHDKAFDRGYITITTDYKLKISNCIYDFSVNQMIDQFFIKYQDKTINLPDKFLPSKEFLEYHNKEIFQS